MLTKILLAIIARSADSIVSFVGKLDAHLEEFLVRHDEDVAASEREIADVRAEADKRVAEIRADIAARNTRAAAVQAIKSTLPAELPSITGSRVQSVTITGSGTCVSLDGAGSGATTGNAS